MELAFSELFGRDILLPSGEKTRLTVLLIDPQNGRVLFGKCGQGFLSSMHLIPKENSWVFQGEVESNGSGENWLGFRVENRKGLKRGRVTEIWIDPLSFQVSKIETERKLLNIWKNKRIYAAEDIFEVLPERKLIVVEEQNRVFRKAEAALSELQQQIPAVTPSGCSSCEKS